MSRRILTALLLSTAIGFPSAGVAGDPLSPRVEVSAKGGNKRSILSTQIWAPLAQRDDRVLYADVRLMGDNDENREGNFGLGYREINPYTNTVIGFHGWYDQRRTENDSTFRQLTFGAESLGHVWDMRVNGYIPLNSGRVFDPGTATISNPYLAGTGIFYDINGLLVETPQYGVDGEVGYRLPVLQDKADAIRVYGGGYHFFRDNTDNVTGFRIRTEAQVNSAFSLGARYQYDEPRGSQGFLEATIRFPFGAKKLYQAEGLRSRLDESAERDVDIVTSAKVAPTKQATARNATGAQQRILYVDNTAATGGDGSLDNPFSTLKDAEAALRAHDILYVNHGDGTTTGMDQGIVIDKANISLIGSGSDLTYAGHTLIAAGLAPTITNTEAPVDSTDLYTGNGVLVTGANGYISGISVNGAQSNGIQFLADNIHLNTTTITQTTAYANNGTGIFINVLNGGSIQHVLASENNSTNNITGIVETGRGILLRVDGMDSSVLNFTASNNTVSGNQALGLTAQARNAGSITNTAISGNEVSGNLFSIYVHAQTNGAMDNVIIQDNNAFSNNQGLFVSSEAGIINNLTIENNISTNNGSHGLQAYANTSGIIRNSYIRNNFVSGAGATGIKASANTNGIIDNVVIENNDVSTSQTSGLSIEVAGNGIISLTDISNNRSFNNNTNGIVIVGSSTGNLTNITIKNNEAMNNTSAGIYVTSTGTSSIITSVSGNTITANGTSGVHINDDTTGAFSVNLGDGTVGTGGNRIFGNNTSNTSNHGDLRLDLDGGTLTAQGNWWGQAGGPIAGQIVNEGACPSCGTADTANALNSHPTL